MKALLLSYLKNVCVGPAGFEPETSRSADLRSPVWANQAAAVRFGFCDAGIVQCF